MKFLNKAFKIVLIALIVSLPIVTITFDDQEHHKDYIATDYTRIISKREFYALIAKNESRNKYNVANPHSMVGKYQASRSALVDFGYSSQHLDSLYKSVKRDSLQRLTFDTKYFTPAEQERFIRWYLKKIENVYLKDIIEKYDNTVFNGIIITKAGILYASLFGFNNVRNYFETNGIKNFTDANGISIRKCLLKFQFIEFEEK